MKACEIKFTETATDTQKSVIENLVECSKTLEEIITGWILKPKQEVGLFQGVEDEKPEVDLIGVVLKDSGEQLAEVYYLKEDVAQSHKELVLVSKYIRGYDKYGHLDLDDEAIESWQTSLGFSFSGALCEEIAPKRALMPFVLSYVLSDGGDVSIRNGASMDPESIEDMQEDLNREKINLEDVLLIYANYQSREVNDGVLPGWGCHKYIRLDAANNPIKSS